jgi:hypothetical protein
LRLFLASLSQLSDIIDDIGGANILWGGLIFTVVATVIMLIILFQVCAPFTHSLHRPASALPPPLLQT